MTSSNDSLTLFDPDSNAPFLVSRDEILAGQAANNHAARGVFVDYLSRKADNTIRRQTADPARFAEYLNQVGEQAGMPLGAALSAFAQEAGGWSSLAMPRRYLEESEIANDGMA
jgi:hypothetical protein